MVRLVKSEFCSQHNTISRRDEKPMKRIFKAYSDLLSIIFKEAPIMVILTFLFSVLLGLLTPFGVYVNEHIFNDGIKVALGEIPFANYSIYLVLFVLIAIFPSIVSNMFIYGYVQPYSLLILRTKYKAHMLQKIKTMKYEHLENESSLEIIDKAYNRAENSVMHLWPMYISKTLQSIIASIGTIYYLFSIKWWLPLTVLIPFILETYFDTKSNYNIYEELESYWNRERQYDILGGYLMAREYNKELKFFGNADYLIDTYKNRLNGRNKEYENYFFKHLRVRLIGGNITKIATLANIFILFILFINNQMTVGLFIAISAMIYGSIYNILNGSTHLFRASGYHILFFDYYDKFFNLSDEEEGKSEGMPNSFDIEFKNVWFKYPGSEKDILRGLTMKIKNGEKASIVGENGEGKSTIVKLILGLFLPDKGEILIGGKKLNEYPLHIRAKIFGPVFQDFQKYSMTVKENIGIGNVEEMNNEEKIKAAAEKGKADKFTDRMSKGYDTLLGRDFEGGVDISGGQWQRIAISRAFMGNKQILLLDEPTSQLDPMAEADLYRDFADLVDDKTALFITHRLGATMITDTIFVINEGKVAEAGTHDELMHINGIYSKMFSTQKQWYEMKNVEANDNV